MYPKLRNNYSKPLIVDPPK